MLKLEKSICEKDMSCGLCHSIINDGNFVVIEETIEQVLDVLLLKLDSTERDKSIMCHTCSSKLFAAFNFKATCMDTEDCIFPYIDFEMGAPADLSEIYLKIKGKEHLKDMLEDERICRLCMQVITCGFMSIKKVDVDSSRMYIPEVNFISVREPVICEVCLDSLDTHTSFIRNCLILKEKFKNISSDKAIKSPLCLTTEETELKSEDYNDCSCEDEPVDNKSDCQSEYTDATNNSTHNTQREPTRMEGKNFWLKHQDSTKVRTNNRDSDYETSQNRYLVLHKDITKERALTCESYNYKTFTKSNHHNGNFPKKQMYKCHLCDFKTIYKSSLVRHQLQHKDMPEEMFKCDSCDFKTIYKRNLTQHRLKHEDIPEKEMFKCYSCNFKTIYKGSLRTHQVTHKNIPEGEMLKCDSCNFKTIHKKNLMHHQLKHKAFSQKLECNLCDYKTWCKIYLTQHQLRHKDNPEENILKCDSCDFKTIYKRSLMEHQVTHKNTLEVEMMLKCDSCDYKTIHKRNLTRHLLKHKDITEKTLKCGSCNYKTIYKHSFTRHQLQHKGIPERKILK
ncbi:zinc finger protein 578-like [Anoplophora glabripennis]|uniref:zinc finger protein 578-like n=1 Tax=Anoplophora glabripennis TaxID=217634 RepID=UPI000873DADE|nr:zinc finger protein 578-like [Anoplophora glabripennis]